MRTVVFIAVLCAPALALAGPLDVHVIVKEERTTWQPVDLEDVERSVGQAALEALSASGQLKLIMTTEQQVRANPPSYLLRITGRMLDEAETHSVYLSFEPKSGAAIGSVRTSQTVSLSKLDKKTMLARMQQSAKAAAAELWASLKTALARGNQAPPPLDLKALPELPWKWSAVLAPSARLPSAADLTSSDNEKRQAALRELTSIALHKTEPRHALEACALSNPHVDIRRGCLEALRPIARDLPQTQRIVIEVFRKDKESRIVNEASEQMHYFTGAGQQDAIAAWMERAAKGQVYGPFASLGDLPNLDLTIARCILAKGQLPNKWERERGACIEMLRPVPHERRKAILWPFLTEVDPDSPRYLGGAGEREGSTGTDWQRAVEAYIEDAPRFPSGLDEVLWRRYERTLSSSSLDILASHAEPSPLLAQRFLEAIQTGGSRDALMGLERFVKEDPKLRDAVIEKVSELLATESYHKKIKKPDLERLLKKAKGEKT